VGGTDHCTIVNNTLYANDIQNTGSGEFQIQYYATNNVFKNNILYGSSQGLLVNNFTSSEPNPASLDYNLYYSVVGTDNATFVWNGVTYTGFSSYRSSTGQDAHSKFADPQFLNPSTPDLHVRPSSPAANAGINLGVAIEGTKDYAGNPRVQRKNIDMGAYEQ